MILQNICGRVVGNVLLNISPFNILPIVLKHERLHTNCQAGLAAVSINRLMIPLDPKTFTGSMLMGVLSKALPLIASCLSPLSPFESQSGM